MLKESSKMLRVALGVAIRSADPLPADVQRGAWFVADAAKDATLLAELVSRADLPEDLVAVAKTRKEIPIRVAYLRRASVSRTERMALLASESRAGVLAGVCADGTFDGQDDLVALLTERMSAKPTRALAEAVLALSGGTPMLYALALVEMSSRGSLTSDMARWTSERAEVVASSATAAERYLTSMHDKGVQQPAFGRIVSAAGVSDQARLAVLTGPLAALIAELRARSGHAVVRSYVQPEHAVYGVVSRMLEAPDVSDRVLVAVKSALEPVVKLAPRTMALIDAYNPGEAAQAAAERAALLARAEHECDPQAQLELVDASERDHELRAALLRNAQLSAPALRQLVIVMARYQPEQALALARKVGEELVLVVYAVSPARAIRVDDWASVSDPAAARVELVRALAVEQDALWQAYSRLLELLEFIPAGDPALGEVPWPLLNRLMNSYQRDGNVGVKLCHYLACRQEEVLGSTPEKWEMLAVLAEDFAGSIDELVQTAATL